MSKKVCHVEITTITSMPRVLRACESAVEAGMQVMIIGVGENTNYNGIDFIGLKKSPNLIHRFLIRSRRMIKIACKSDADIVQLHSPELLLYWRKLRKSGKKIIFDSHEFYSYQIKIKKYLPKSVRTVGSQMYRIFENHVLKKIDAVLYPCTINGVNYFEKRAKRVVKVENFSTPMNIIRDEYDIHTVIYAGGLCEERGIGNDAAAIMKSDGKLILCGEPSEQVYLDRLLNRYPKNKLEYKGSLPRKELFELYCKSGIGICTLLPIGQYTHIDNLSTKIYEYMQCGLPVIFSAFPYAVKMNEKYNFGIPVHAENIEEIANAIQYLIDNPEEARKMGENGQRAIREEFNWDCEKKKLLALYDNILK